MFLYCYFHFSSQNLSLVNTLESCQGSLRKTDLIYIKLLRTAFAIQCIDVPWCCFIQQIIISATFPQGKENN
jgi:hypothetical protein